MTNEKVSILLSIYKPNKDFLKKQLLSLNEQTYENLELIIWNDCPEVDIDEEIFSDCITSFPYKLYNEKINLGYIKAFEKLVTLATGEYVCFCDQDDIWEKDKIKECIIALKKENGTISVCDKSIIDENDNVITKTVRKNSKMRSLNWNTGDEIACEALFFCYATGMSIHAKKSDVEKYIPFIPNVAHDRYITVMLSEQGKAVYVDKPLVKYRRHQKNKTGTLSGINNKEDYYLNRCDNTELIKRFENYFPDNSNLEKIKVLNQARKKGNPFLIFKYRKFIPDLYKYEILLCFCPNFIFRFLKKFF